VYQRMYGCVWDDETGLSHGFDEYGYDGEDFIKLDLKENRYIAHVPQAIPTVEKWNNDTAQLASLKQYYDDYDDECVHWLKKFLMFSKADLERRGMLSLFFIVSHQHLSFLMHCFIET